MRIAIVIAGALIAHAINPGVWQSIDPSPGVMIGFVLFCLVLFAMDLVEAGGK